MNDWNTFDRELSDSLSALPLPDETAQAVTPWQDAVHRIVLGLCLTFFTFQFLYLQYLLPLVGALQLYLGLRSLRENNRWFHVSYVCGICKVFLIYAFTLLAATPLGAILLPVWAPLSTVLTLTLLVSLRLALRSAAASLGRVSKRDPLLAALLWYLLLMGLALFLPDIGWVGGFPMVVAFVCIIRSLLRVSTELDDWGYAVRSAPVKVSQDRLSACYYGSLVLLTLVCTLFYNHLPLRALPLEPTVSTDTAALQTRLAARGFPEDLSSLLLPEDLQSLSDAVPCDAEIDELSFGSDSENIRQNKVFVFQLPDGSVRVLHLFTLAETDGPGRWQNSLSLQANAALSDVVFRLQYTKAGTSLCASPETMEIIPERGIDYFGSKFEQYTAATAPFSWPSGTKDRRGYVLFTADQPGNPQTLLTELLSMREASLPHYPLQDVPAQSTWSYGQRFYFGDGTGLLYKADEAASAAASR